MYQLKPWTQAKSIEKTHPYLYKKDPVDDFFIPYASPDRYMTRRDEEMDLQFLLFLCDISGYRSAIQKRNFIKDYAEFVPANNMGSFASKMIKFFTFLSFNSYLKDQLTKSNSPCKAMTTDQAFEYYVACKFFEKHPKFLQQRFPMFYRSDQCPTIKFISFENAVPHLMMDENTGLFHVSTFLLNIAKKYDILVLETKDKGSYYLCRAPGYLNNFEDPSSNGYSITSLP
ncbi:unnamed protein product [[Candida] boidinii]|nr:hypothetical protein BVG19_g1793 [[Candida] boidinii]OWB53634.1 hypothetical protein B5S27_g5239 [[Candida] boidinii]GME93904.1 unnamed protein product [[Candida] boidinii]